MCIEHTDEMNMKILYVEDDPRDADIAVRHLQKASPHMRIETVAKFDEALARLERLDAEPLDLVLTDVRLPDGDGLSLLAQIRDRGLPLAVVVITGTGDEETAIAALKTGADDYVVKRKDYVERLPATLESALYRYRAEAERRTRPLRVLYAGHDQTDVGVTRHYMASHASHIHLDTVSTGVEAIHRLTKDRGHCEYDVILLDYSLSGLDALELLKELRLTHQLDVPVVLATGHGDEEVAVQSMKLGAASYIVKNPGYLHKLPTELENASFRAQLIRREKALLRSEEFNRKIVESSNDSIKILDLEGTLLYMSRKGREALGIGELDSFLNSSWLDFWDGADRHAAQKAIEEAKAGGIGSMQGYCPTLHGEPKWWDIVISPMMDGNGTVERLLAISRDITDSKLAAEALHETEARNDAMLKAIPDLMFLLSKDGVFLDYNARDQADLFLPPEQFIGKSVKDVMPVELAAEFSRCFELAFQSDDPVVTEYSLQINGQDRYYECQIVGCNSNKILTIARDITERRRAQETLEQSEERWRRVFENSAIGIALGDLDGRLFVTNAAFNQMLGYQDHELPAITFEDITHEDDRELSRKLIGELLDKRKQQLQIEKRLRRKDGQSIWVSSNFSVVAGTEHSPPFLMAIVEHITDRKLAQDSLRESEVRFRQLAENIGAVFFMNEVSSASSPGRTLYVSPAYESIWGRSSESLYRDTRSWVEAVHPEDRNRIEQALEGLQWGQFSEEYRIVRPDGEVRWIYDRVFPVYDERGEWYRVAGIAEDITERKQSEEALRESEVRYRSVVNSQAELICRYLPDTTLTFVNEAYCSYFGKTRDQLIGTSFIDLLPESAREAARKHVASLITEPQFGTTEHQVLLPDGTIGWQRWLDYPVVDADGEIVEFQGIGRDITERKIAEIALLHRDQLLEAMFHSLSSDVVMLDRDGIVTYASRSWDEFAGTDQTPAQNIQVGVNYLEMVRQAAGDQIARKVLDGIKRVLAGEIPSFFIECPNSSSSEQRWYLMNVDPMPPEHGGVVISHTDITHRKRVEESLEEALGEVQLLKDQLHAENIYLQEAIMVAHNFGEIIGRSEPLKRVQRQAEQVAPLDTTVLILGETGTGKELLAHAIHNLSPRKKRPLIKVNCATLPTHLIESELFGHEKGAFTGALARRGGRFEIANGGTIFLDEIGELPLDLQSKLLRVLQEGEFERLGSSHTLKVDVRVIAATNRDLEEAVRKGMFRSDLYYRLSIFPITVPPLRERKEDIPLLVMQFVKQLSVKLGKEIESISQTTMEALKNYSWPGNVRELRNVIERAAIITQGTKLRLLDSLESRPVIQELQVAPAAPRGDSVQTLTESQRSLIISTLEKTYWRVEGPDGAAALLGVHPNTLRSRLKKLGIEKPKFKNENLKSRNATK